MLKSPLTSVLNKLFLKLLYRCTVFIKECRVKISIGILSILFQHFSVHPFLRELILKPIGFWVCVHFYILNLHTQIVLYLGQILRSAICRPHQKVKPQNSPFYHCGNYWNLFHCAV